MGCENCGGSRTYLFATPEGHKLCTECTSEFISWVQENGITEDPEHWAAAMYDPDL